MISATLYYIVCGILSILALVGISMMSKVKTSVNGNLLLSLIMLVGLVLTLFYYNIFNDWIIYVCIAIGLLIGARLAKNIQMIQMPQAVAMLNGLGGLAGAIVGALTLVGIGVADLSYPIFVNVTATLAVIVGMVTFSGSMVAAGKLHRLLPQQPVVWKQHELITTLLLIGSLATVVLSFFVGQDLGILSNPNFILALAVVLGSLFGYVFAIRVGGADMPITISLLTSLAGVAAAIAGMAIGDILVVSVGGIVGSSGLLLTQIMCKAMNRKLMVILTGKTAGPSKVSSPTGNTTKPSTKVVVPQKQVESTGEILRTAKSAIIVPGYGMALAQAQHQVRQLADMLQAQGTQVRYAIHPVAGRMPGHMNVLLAETDVPYEQLFEMDTINEDFKDTDVVIVIGANDVLNPAARDAEGTPIYGMPVLNVDQAKKVFICNFDTKPGYAGVPNPLYEMTDKVSLKLGDAKESLNGLMQDMREDKNVIKDAGSKQSSLGNKLRSAKSAIIVPGYGMALAQAQHQVRQLADMLEAQGTQVRYAIHPVAGRMPGHMNVLLAETDVPYEQLFEMDAINDDFKDTDIVIVIGANDVLNPAARDAEGTPIYGMPVLNVDQAKAVVICNFDTKPGYAGVPNPLYEMTDKVSLKLGDAKESLNGLMQEMREDKNVTKDAPKQSSLGNKLKTAKSAIIVPGYGMALAQAQHQVRQLADMLEAQGTKVRYAVHPVAGRMPGHMNVLLAETDVPYEQLFEMDAINDDFKDTDIVIVIGANDVLNPAARDAEGTPIYGMPVLNVDQAKAVIICNFDTKPGYAGVPNPLYEMTDKVSLKLGDAKESLNDLMQDMREDTGSNSEIADSGGQSLADDLKTAKSAIIVPGYGMALAQAQHQVRQLADALEAQGTQVRYAIHPVAGRMPGHMNVLLAEADVSYEQLFEMDAINDDFKNTDIVVVIGANDVLNPAARDAEGTPIYGMPVLNVDEAKKVVICNFDTKPGYAGVPNPLYEMTDKVTLMLGDAKESLNKLIQMVH